MTSPIERTVALFEMHDRSAALAQLGEWRLERALEKLDAVLADTLSPVTGGGHDHQIDRTPGNAEIVAVLQGVDRHEALGRLQTAIARFQHDTGLRVLSAWCHDDSGNRPLGAMFACAEQAMHQRRSEVLAEAA